MPEICENKAHTHSRLLFLLLLLLLPLLLLALAPQKLCNVNLPTKYYLLLADKTCRHNLNSSCAHQRAPLPVVKDIIFGAW